MRDARQIPLRPVLKLLAAAVLITGQAGVVLAGLFWPRVTQAYRATYIDQSRDCWLPAEAPAFQPPQNVIVPFNLSGTDACSLLPKGWNTRDATNIWSNGHEASINVPLRPGDVSVTLRLQGYSQNIPQIIEISTAGAAPQRLEILPGTVGKVSLPAVKSGNMQRIDINIAHVHRPTDTDVLDWRAIGISVLDIERVPRRLLPGQNSPSS